MCLFANGKIGVKEIPESIQHWIYYGISAEANDGQMFLIKIDRS
jgi:hypothetical protein